MTFNIDAVRAATDVSSMTAALERAGQVNVGSAGAADAAPEPVALSSLGLSTTDPTGLIADTGRQLSTYDGQVTVLRTSMEQSISASNEVGKQERALRAISAAISALGKKSDDRVPLESLNVRLDDGSTVSGLELVRRAGLEGVLQVHHDTHDGQPRTLVSASGVDQAIESCKSRQSAINSQNELTLLQLQQITHLRSQLIEVSSQLLRSTQRTADAVVQNLGR